MNLPNAEQEERMIIGALMLNPSLIVQADIPATDFYWPSTRDAYLTISALYEEGEEITPPSIHYRTQDLGRPISVTDLSKMLTDARGLTSIRQQVSIVREKALKRRIAHVTSALNAGALNGEKGLDLIQKGEEALAEMRLSLGGSLAGFRPLKEIDAEAGVYYEKLRRGESDAIATGYKQLDDATRGGIHPGDVWVVASLTGRGKSSWAIGAARWQAEQGHEVAFVSREMADVENYTRLLCGAAGVAMWKVRPGMFLDTFQALTEWRSPVSDLPIHINSTTASIRELRPLIKEIVKLKGIKTLFVDYLQLLSVTGEWSDKRAQEVAAVSRSLKEIAMENKIGVFALAQFNRLAAFGERPELHHLAESGGIEKDASLVLILDMNEQKDGETERPCTMRIAKHRNGPLMSLKYRYRGDTLTFWDAA
jgi:replicative DNA helicase